MDLAETPRMKLHAIVCIGFCALFAAPQQERVDDTKKEKPKPRVVTKYHKLLARDAGTWDAVVRIWPGPNVAPIVSKATETGRILGSGLWLISDVTGQMLGKKYSGHLVLGYDEKKKRYVGTWVNTMSTGIVELEGTWNEKEKRRTLWFTMICPITRKPCRARLVTFYPAAGKRTVLVELPEPGTKGKGRYYPIRELKLTKRSG